MSETIDPRTMTADTIGKDILSAIVTELKLLPKPWPKLSESKQNDIIDRLRDRVDSNVKMAVHLIASQGLQRLKGATLSDLLAMVKRWNERAKWDDFCCGRF